MVPIAKVAASVGIACLGCYGVYRISDTSYVSPVKTIKQLNKSSSYEGKFGKDFHHHFAGFDEASGSIENREWWERSYEKRYSTVKDKSSLSAEFQKIEGGFGNESGKHLSRVCHEAYGKDLKKDIFPDSDSDGNKKKYREDIWKFCSLSGAVPKAPISVAENTWGKELQTKLVDVEENGSFWSRQNEEFKNYTSDQDTFFTSKLKGENKKVIKDICREAYSMSKEDSSDANKPKEEDILKYCSLTRK